MDTTTATIDAQLIATDVIFGITMFLLMISLPCLIYFRNSPYVKQRNYRLTLFYWFISVPWMIRFRFNTRDEILQAWTWIPCEALIWFGNISVILFTNMLLVRIIRMLLIFNITKWKLNNEVSEETTKKPFWCKEKFYSTEYCLRLYGILVGISFLFMFPFGLYSAATGVCTKGLLTYSTSLPTVMMCVMSVIIYWKLRKVHDAYAIKIEFKIICWFGLLGLPLVALLDITSWAWTLGFLLGACWLNTSLVVPLVLCFKEKYYDLSYNSSSDETKTEEESSIGDDVNSEPKSVLLCNDPHYRKYFRDFTNMVPFLEQYILHFQEVKASHDLLFAINVLKFKELSNAELLTGKAYLIVQKFLAENAYVPLQGLDTTLVERVVKQISSAVQSVEENWDPEAVAVPVKTVDDKIFDEILTSVTNNLLVELFKPFFKSEYFQQYLAKATLKMV